MKKLSASLCSLYLVTAGLQAAQPGVHWPVPAKDQHSVVVENPFEKSIEKPQDKHQRRAQKTHHFTHNIQLQLFDNSGFPVEGTQFWVKLNIHKEDEKVIISLPTINFLTGPVSSSDPVNTFPGGGGTLRTTAGFLPECLRPTDPVYRSYLVPSNNGQSLSFSYSTPFPDLPVPPSGYILSVTLAGGLVIQGAGTFNNLIASGPQVLMPTDISYYHVLSEQLCKNVVISRGASNVTQFSNVPPVFGPAGSAYRDTHVNDAFDNVLAWAWADNSMVADKSNNVTNVMVAVGKVKNGKLKIRHPIQLTDNTNNPNGTFVFDTAVAINRTNSDNIVVSWGIGNLPTTPYRAVSFDGGITWPINGPTNIQPIPPAADNRGVAADKFGNIWYCSTNDGAVANQPTFWVSSDGGNSFSVAYDAEPFLINGTDFGWDFPQFCFGGDGSGDYGLWFVADYYPGLPPADVLPAVGFIPITGLGLANVGAGTTQFLSSLLNTQLFPNITAAEDGRVWCESYTGGGFPTFPMAPEPSLILPSVLRFKSPQSDGGITSNYAESWQLTISNFGSAFYGVDPYTSFPGSAYFNSAQTILYDETRQALYAIFAQRSPDFSQNMKLFLIISRDNGQTWSEPLYIASSDFANRGFQSMALDSVTGNLVFGWYDGRNDKTMQSVEYFGAVIPAKTLDKLVKRLPSSNPLYAVPPAG